MEHFQLAINFMPHCAFFAFKARLIRSCIVQHMQMGSDDHGGHHLHHSIAGTYPSQAPLINRRRPHPVPVSSLSAASRSVQHAITRGIPSWSGKGCQGCRTDKKRPKAGTRRPGRCARTGPRSLARVRGEDAAAAAGRGARRVDLARGRQSPRSSWWRGS